MESSTLMSIMTIFLIGLILGVIYFSALWWTLKRVTQSRRPAVWLLASFVLRMGLLLAVLYWIGAGDWRSMIAILAGVLIVRVIMTHRARATLAREKAGLAPKI